MKRFYLTILSISIALMLISGCVTATLAYSSSENTAENVTDEEAFVGGFSGYMEPLDHELEIFYSIMENYDSEIVYTPILLKTQIVAGLNYIFLAEAQPLAEHEEAYEVEIKIYQSLTDAPELIEIIKR